MFKQNGGTIADVSVKFQTDAIIQTMSPADSRFNEILR